MDNEKTGALIKHLREEKHLTQREVGLFLGLTDKAVSKWERGFGSPAIDYLDPLSQLLGVSTEALLTGEFKEEKESSGNLKKGSFFLCPKCKNITYSTNSASIFCCSRHLLPLKGTKAREEETLKVRIEGDELFISSLHPMNKNSYISFISILSSDSVYIKKLYPEWSLDLLMPLISRHGMLYYYSTTKGLFYQNF